MDPFFAALTLIFALEFGTVPNYTEMPIMPTNGQMELSACFSEQELAAADRLLNVPKVQTYVRMHEYESSAMLYNHASGCTLYNDDTGRLIRSRREFLLNNTSIFAVRLMFDEAKRADSQIERIWVLVAVKFDRIEQSTTATPEVPTATFERKKS